MPNLKEVRTRIASVKSTQQITSAMKMVAASKLRRSQGAILQMRPYAAKLKEILQNLSASLDTGDGGSIYSDQREPKNVLVISLSSNRGLCGAFNANVIKETSRVMTEKYAGQYREGRVKLLAIGKKVNDHFRRRNVEILDNRSDIFDHISFEKVLPLAEQVMKLFADKQVDRVDVVYNQFKNAATQKLIVEQFLPVEPVQMNNSQEKTRTDYIFEPGKEEIVLDLIPKTLKIQFYKMLLDSYASEHGARMTAMHQATDNAKELLRELSLAYNKARQASITKEILEIVSGAEALKG